MANLNRGLVRIKINPQDNWIDLPVPAEDGLQYDIQTTVDSARNSANVMIGNPIGQDKIKLTITYPPLTDKELHDIISIFDREQGGSYKVYVNYYDPRVGYRVTRYMYVGDRSFTPWIVDDPNIGKPRRWINTTCNLIEC